jgi:internalin A
MRSHCAGSACAFRFSLLTALCFAATALVDPLWIDAADQPLGGRAAASDKSVEKLPGNQGGVEVLFQFADGRSQKIEIASRTIAITTAYGKLEIAVEDIRTIELAQRLPEETSRQVRAAIARLESADEKDRSAATAELFNLREKSFLALLRASRSKRKDLARRAKELVDDLRPLVPRHFLSAPIWDVIETDTSRFAGEIDLAAVGPGDSRLGQIEANTTDRDVALWVLSNGGAVWTNKADRMIRAERQLPPGDFRLVRIHLHDQTAQASFHGPYFPAINRIEFTREDIERLASLKELAYLEFSSARVTDDVLRRLSKLTTLERLILCGTRITDGGLSALVGMKRLNRLDLCETAVTDEGLNQIAKLKSLTSLDHLAEAQIKWHETPHPPDLFLNNTQTTDAALSQLQEALPQCQISASHVFRDRPVTGMVPLPPVRRTPDGNWAGWLLGYRIGDCDLFTAARPNTRVRHTEELSGPVEIAKLVFNPPNQAREWSTPLAGLMLRRLASLPHLRHLVFGQLPPTGFEDLRGFKHLQSLEFDHVDVADSSLESLGGLTELTSLSITSGQITGSGLPQLRGLRQLRRLEFVECRQLHATDLEALANLPALKVLNLRRSPIDDSAVDSLKKLTQLRTLNLSETKVTPNGKRQLGEALPKCRISGATGS